MKIHVHCIFAHASVCFWYVCQLPATIERRWPSAASKQGAADPIILASVTSLFTCHNSNSKTKVKTVFPILWKRSWKVVDRVTSSNLNHVETFPGNLSTEYTKSMESRHGIAPWVSTIVTKSTLGNSVRTNPGNFSTESA